MHEYKVNIVKVVDGDTVDVDIDLGFGIWLRNERVRVMGIDTPESRTSDKIEKIFGLAAKNRLISLLGAEAILHTQVSKKGEDMKGKFGRVLGNFTSINGEKCAAVLIREGHAVAYQGGSKENIASQHLANRERLVLEGKVEAPEGMSIAPIKNAPPPTANDDPIVKSVELERGGKTVLGQNTQIKHEDGGYTTINDVVEKPATVSKPKKKTKKKTTKKK